MTAGSPDLGEQALSKIVEAGMTSQLDEAETMDVDIRTNPVKLMQGEVDSVTIVGKGLVMKQDLRMETLEINTDKISINPLNAIFGNIELDQSTNAEAHIVLLDSDLNRALSSDFVQAKLRGLKMTVEGQPVTIDVKKAEVSLPGDKQLVVNADFLLVESGESKQLTATAVPKVEQNGQCIALDVLSAEGQGLTDELNTAIFDQIASLLDLRNFNLPVASFKVHTLEAQQGKLVIHATTEIDEIPSA
jgi:hypothetical protein